MTRLLRKARLALRELYHQLRVCPACRAGRIWLPGIGGGGCHVSPANRRVIDPRTKENTRWPTRN